MQQGHGLGEVDDVDVVADAENIGSHLRVPAMRLVAEMSAGFEEAAHGVTEAPFYIILRLNLRGPWAEKPATGARP